MGLVRGEGGAYEGWLMELHELHYSLTLHQKIALECYKLRNYNSLKAILAGLHSGPVHRLEKSWKHVSTDRTRCDGTLCVYTLDCAYICACYPSISVCVCLCVCVCLWIAKK